MICGSAASWMIAKVLHQKGGLHNRVTRSLALQPFSLAETEAFLCSRKLQLERPQLLELAMVLGGCPYYLDYVRPGRSAAQTIDALFFAPGAALRDEFDQLFAALFEHHERHLEVIRFLARRQSGFNRTELAEATSFGTGGNLTTILQELEASGFVARTPAFGHQARDPLYRLIDEYTLFHLRWLQGRHALSPGGHRWLTIRGTPTWHAWSGYSFENLCLRHVGQIKRALGISGVQTEEASWRKASPEGGAQIDLLIDRRDGVINVCEMKFSSEEFVIDKRYAEELRQKLAVFRRISKTRKSLFLTFVTPFGLKPNAWRQELVQNSVTGDALFQQPIPPQLE